MSLTETSWTAESAIRLDKFLVSHLEGFSRSKLSQLIDEGQVLVDGNPQKSSYILKPGMTVSVIRMPESAPHDLSPAEMPIRIVYEDADLLVVVKPRGVATHPAPSLREPTMVNALLGMNMALSEGAAEFRPGIVHRLDKETTGLLIIAKNDAAHANLASQIASKTAERRYVGLAHGVLPEERLRIEAPISRDRHDRRKMAIDPKGKPAVTHVKLLQVSSGESLFAARLETGRTHQIRVHLSGAGYPLLGDRIYSRGPVAEGALQLHAAYLRFDQPTTGKSLELFEAPPEDFRIWKLEFESAIKTW